MRAEQSSHQIETYQIIVSGHLDFKWKDWFDGFDISHQANNETLMVGPVADQAALHGPFKSDQGIEAFMEEITTLSSPS